MDLASLPVPSGPGQDPELRLRNFLDQIDRAIKTFDTDAKIEDALEQASRKHESFSRFRV